DIAAGLIARAALAHNDPARQNGLAAVYLHTQPLGSRRTAVTAGPLTFLVSHCLTTTMPPQALGALAGLGSQLGYLTTRRAINTLRRRHEGNITRIGGEAVALAFEVELQCLVARHGRLTIGDGFRNDKAV